MTPSIDSPAAGQPVASSSASHEAGTTPAAKPLWQRGPVRALLYIGVGLLLFLAYKLPFLPSLSRYFLYMCCATTVTPLPTYPVIFIAAMQTTALWVGVIGAAGTTVAYLLEYAVLGSALQHGEKSKVKDNRVYRWLSKVFRTAPFLALTLTAFLPIPVDGVRLMAISEKYNRVRYALAAFIGRVPRYFLIALPIELAQRHAGDLFFRVVPGSLGTPGPMPVSLVVFIVGATAVLGFAAVRHLRARRQLATVAFVAAFFAAMPPASASATEPGPPPPVELTETLARFDAAVASLVDARAHFAQDVYNPVFEDTEHTEGTLSFRAPGDLVLIYDDPHQEFYTDSTGTWLYLVAENQAQFFPFNSAYERAASNAVLWQPSSVLAERYRIAYPDAPPAGEQSGVWLALTPTERDVADVLRAFYIRIDSETALSDCLVAEHADGKRIRFEVTDFVKNPGLDAADLQFEPPPGVDLVRH